MRGKTGFRAFVAAQALGAFNDNAFKTWIALSAVVTMGPAEAAKLISLAGALFIAPFLIFSTHAGWVADRWDKRRLIVLFKVLELLLLVVAWFCLGSLPALLTVLFLMGVHSAFFSPVKLAVVPELVGDAELSQANGTVQATTFGGIILGTAAAAMRSPWPLLFGAAAVGLAASVFIPALEPAGPSAPFELNPVPQTLRSFAALRGLRGVMLATVGSAYFWFVAAIFQMNLVALARGPQAAWLQIVVALGIGGGSWLAGRLSREQVELGLVPLGALALAGFAFWLGASVSPLRLFCLGAAAGVFSLPLQAFIQQRSPASSRGRIFAVGNLMCFAAILAASAVFPLLVPGTALVVVGVMTLVVAGYIIAVLPEFLVRLLMYLPAGLFYRIHVDGLENVPAEGPALLVSNHISFIDPFLIGVANRRLVRFLMFRAYYDLPVVHHFFKAMRCIPVSDHDGAKALVASLQKAREALENGELVCIFAEGEISRHGQMLRFKKGFERIVGGLDVPVIPVHLDQVWGSVFSFSGGGVLFKRPRRIPYPVTVSFGKPLPKDADAFACRQAIVELSSAAFSRRLDKAPSLGRSFTFEVLRHPFRLASVDSFGRRLTYLGLWARAKALPRWSGERVGVLLPPSVPAVVVNVGLTLAGQTPVNLNYTASSDIVAQCCRKAGLSTVVTSRAFVEKLGWAPPGAVFLEDVKPRWSGLLEPSKTAELAAVMFTSGSTGVPKGVMLTQANVLSNIEAVGQVYALGAGDRILGILPFFHSFGFTGTLWLPLLRGMTGIFHVNPLDARKIGELVSRHRATFLLGTPTFLSAYLRRVEPEKFRTLRVAVVGAEKLREDVATAFEQRFGLRPLEGYGCTELSPVAAVNIPDIDWPGVHQKGAKAGSIGQPLPGVFVKIVDPDTGAERPAGEPGLLLVKGPNVMKGYLDDPQRTAEVVVDGYYHTGDIAALDVDGFITLTDRLSRFSKIGGEMVPHIKVEEKLHEAAGAVDQTFVVVSAPDDKRGEKLVVLYKGDQDPAALLAKLDVPNLWKPDARDFKKIDEFPVLGTGKLDLQRLKAMAASAS